MTAIAPDEIDLTSLPSVTFEEKRQLPKVAGIYFALSFDSQILYIGRSGNLRQRWNRHHRHVDFKNFGSIKIAWLQVSDESLLPVVENALIDYFNPLLNEKNDSPPRQVNEPRVYVDLSKYWPNGLSVNAAYEELLMQGRKVDRRTLSAAKAGTLVKSEYLTLIRLRDWVRQLTGNQDLCTDDLFKIEE